MDITSESLNNLRVGFNNLFQQGFDTAEPDHEMIAMTVNSTRGSEAYGWMKQIPGLREWVGDRLIHALEEADYVIKNKDYEDTISVDRNHIEDDALGIYNPLFQEMGRVTAVHAPELCYAALKAGFTTTCWDGQYFFDTDHPILDENGNETSYSNTQAGAGEPWFLIDDTRAIKPILLQERRSADFVALDDPNDENVFHRKEYIYGVDLRRNVGYTLPFLAFGSRAELNAANFEAALAAMQSFKGDHGRPGGVSPGKLVTGPLNRSKGATVLEAQLIGGGDSNINYKAVDLHVSRWLA